MLSELAIDNKEAFSDLVKIAKDALEGKKYTPKKRFHVFAWNLFALKSYAKNNLDNVIGSMY